MKNIYKKINISSSLILIFFLSFISGLFKDMIIFFTIIFVHELGHILLSLYYGWNIKEINFNLCGGYITYDEKIDKPFKEEFLISIAGVITQTFFIIIVLLINDFAFINYKIMFMFKKYYISILFFNLLPIIPLDGSKIINVIFNMFFSYKKSLKLTNYLSFITIFVIIILFIFKDIKIECSYIMMLIFIINKIIKHYMDIPYLFNKFLFERYNSQFKFNKRCYIKGSNLNKMKRQNTHIFKINKKYYTEKRILNKKFDYF